MVRAAIEAALPDERDPSSDRPGRRPWRIPWRWLRRVTQIACLIAVLILFRLTEYRGQDVPGEPLNLLFRINPLTAVSAMLGTLSWTHLAWPALVVLGLTIVFGRFFCGWVCPLGTVLDGCHRAASPLRSAAKALAGGGDQPLRPVVPRRRLGAIRYVLLILVLLFGALHVPIVGYVDPLALLYRGLSFAIDPWFGVAGSAVLRDTAWAEAARGTALPFYGKAYTLAWVAAAMLAAVLLAELLARRFWCRYVCPLGAMLGLVGKVSPLVRVPVGACGNCPAAANCAHTCRMNAFDDRRRLRPDACTLCMDCVADCPRTIATFRWRRPRPAAAPVDLSRRAALASLAAGVAVPLVARAAGAASHAAGPYLLRPPGADDDDNRFTDACVRCGLCIKVCPTGALQPARLQAGIDGIFSPVLTPRTGYCEAGCTLCGQVCPTGAIPLLAREQKEQVILGRAMIDRTRCLPWTTGEQCICCEEHCPVWDKAIHFREAEVTRPDGTTVTVEQPYVRFHSCTGCGLCENKCPVEGAAAIRVVRAERAFPDPPPPRHRRRRGNL
jgi:polyferredoxin